MQQPGGIGKLFLTAIIISKASLIAIPEYRFKEKSF